MRLIITVLFCFIFNMTTYSSIATEGKLLGHMPAVEEVDENVIPDLTVENLKLELERVGVKESDVVLRQAIWETGWFKCTSCSLGSNNLFGFFYKGKYLQFDNWVESVAYYKWWQDKLYTGGDYYAFLEKVGFATTPRYVAHLESLKGLY